MVKTNTKIGYSKGDEKRRKVRGICASEKKGPKIQFSFNSGNLLKQGGTQDKEVPS